MAHISAPASSHGNKVTLYWLDRSRSQRILWLLGELEIPYELEIVHRQENMLAPAESKKIHPLGKFPIVTIETDDPSADRRKKIVLAESGFITEYLCDHYDGAGKGLVPARYPPSLEDKVGLECESWMRYRFYLHYAEGSLMGNLTTSLIIQSIYQSAPTTSSVEPNTANANKVASGFLNQQFETHFSFLEDQLKTAPDGGPYLCGSQLTAADILMSFPIMAATEHGIAPRDRYPAVNAYATMLSKHEGYKRAIAKIEEIDGKFTSTL